MWASLFLVGTFWFWALLAAAAVVLFMCIAGERTGRATLSVIATFALLALFGDFNVLAYVRDHGLAFCLYLAGYFAVGTAWAVGKWWFYVRKQRVKYDERKRAFLEGHGVAGDAIPENLKAEWQAVVGGHGVDDYAIPRSIRSLVPRARDNKGKIMTWMVYWPWSFIWTMIDDPIRKFFKMIYNRIQGVLESISARAFQGTENDFPTSPSDPPNGGNPPAATPPRIHDTRDWPPPPVLGDR